MSRRSQITILVAIAGTILVVFLLFQGVSALLRPPPAPPPPAPAPGTFKPTPEQWANLSFAPVRQVDLSGVAATDGKIAADDDHTTQVFSPYSGRVTKVFAKMGDRVAAGAPLFAVQASEYVQAESDLVTAESQLKVATAAEARQKALYQISGAALKDYQQSQADLANAEAGLNAVRNRLRILGKSDGEIKALEAAHAAPVGGELIARSPIGGVVIQRAVGVGQNVGSVTNGGATALFTVSNLSDVWLVANVREADAGALHLGARIVAHPTALPGKGFAGVVNFVAPGVDPNTRRITVRATIPNAGGQLLPEMFADVDVSTNAPKDTLAAPENAVVYDGDEARVWLARPGKALELRKIRAGRTQGGLVEVLSGLAAGDQVVTAGSVFIDRAATND
jgi:cobalt-zinc-cadmium efflux system membrane fusion protein